MNIDELKERINKGFIYECELQRIITIESEKDIKEMNTDIIDLCVSAIINHQYSEI